MKCFLLLLISPIIAFSQINYFPWNKQLIQNSVGSSTPAVSGSEIGMDINEGKIYFVGNDYRIRSYYPINNIDYQESVLNYNAPLANPETGITTDELGNIIYISQNGYINFLRVNNNWNHDQINSFSGFSTYETARDDSKLVVNSPNGHIRINYIGGDSLIHFVEWTGSSWITDILVSYSNKVRKKSKLLKGIHGKIYYIDINDDVQALYPNIGSNLWGVANISNNADDVKQGSDFIIDPHNKLYYVANDSKIHSLFYDNGTWSGGVVDNTSHTVQNNTGFTYNKGNLIYIGTNNTIYSTFFNECDWETEILNENLNSPSSFSSIESFYHNSEFGNTYFFDFFGNLYSLTPGADYKSDFVYLRNNNLMFKGQPFFVKGTNYQLNLNKTATGIDPNTGQTVYNYYLSPYARHCSNIGRCTNDPITAENLVKRDLLRISDMGINTVRVTGLSIKPSQNIGNYSTLYHGVFEDTYENPPITDQCGVVYNIGIKSVDEIVNSNYLNNVYVPKVNQLLNWAEDVNLKIILLTGFEEGNRSVHYPNYGPFLADISTAFQGNSTLLAVDLYNEPTNDWKTPPNILPMTKSEVCTETQILYNSVRNNNDNLLVTVGLYANDVWWWDPIIVASDFIAFHVYSGLNHPTDQMPDRLDLIRNQFSYITSYYDKPWIIGETGFSANPDIPNGIAHGSSADQDIFMDTLLKYSVESGSSGLTWWSYHDNIAGPSPGRYYGLVYNKNSCNSPDLLVNKNIANILGSFVPYCYSGKGTISPAANYYNQHNGSYSIISGKVVDYYSSTPIVNAFIAAKDTFYNGNNHTYTVTNGDFTLNTEYYIGPLEVSAPGYELLNYWVPNGTPSNGIYKLKSLNCSPNVSRKKNFQNSFNEEDELDFSILIYPNPSNQNYFIFNSNNGHIIKNVDIYDTKGQKVKTVIFNSTHKKINVANYSRGIYYARIFYDNSIISKKIVISK